MRMRAIGWRTARALSGDPFRSSPATAFLEAGSRLPSITASATEPTWTPCFVFFLIYTFSVTTYRLPLGTPAIIGGIASLLFQRERFRCPPVLLWHGLLLSWCAVTWAHSLYPDISWDALTLTAKLWLIMLVAANALRTRTQFLLLIVFYIACFLLYPVRGAFVNFFIIGYTLGGRAVWNQVFSNPNDLAGVALLQLSMSIGLVYAFRGLARLIGYVGIALLPLLILFTESRGAFIAFCLAGVLALAMQRRRLRAMAIAGSLAAIVVVSTPSSAWDRFRGLRNATSVANLNEVDGEGSARQRFEIWRVAMTITSEHPVFGIGVGTYAHEHVIVAKRPDFDPTASGMRDAHSTYLTAAAETGLPGLLLLLVLLITMLVRAERTRRAGLPSSWTSRLLGPLELGYIAYLVAGIWGSYNESLYLFVHLTIIAALIESTREMAPRVEHRSRAHAGHYSRSPRVLQPMTGSQ